MSFDVFNHRFNARIARWLSLAMCSTAVTIAIEIWPELQVIKWIALAVAVLMVLFIAVSWWLVSIQVPWRNLHSTGEVIETGSEFFFLIAAVIAGVWVA